MPCDICDTNSAAKPYQARENLRKQIRNNQVRMPMSLYLMKLKCKNSSHDQGRAKDLLAGKLGSKHGSYDRYLSRKMSRVLEKAGELKGCKGCQSILK